MTTNSIQVTAAPDHSLPGEPVETRTVGQISVQQPVLSARAVNIFYGAKQAIKDINLDIGLHSVTALIGPSGCGKSTFLRSMNRMNDTIPGARMTGRITLDGEDIYSGDQDVVQLRARVGMVFQQPNPFPKSIYENVAYGPRIHGLAVTRADLDVIVQSSLQKALPSVRPLWRVLPRSVRSGCTVRVKRLRFTWILHQSALPRCCSATGI